MAGSQSKLSNPDFAKAVAEAYVNGLSRAELADMFGVRKETITYWTRDPRVQAHAGKLAQERVIRIVRKIDSEMEERLSNVDNMDEELLLKIRKEYLARTGSADTPGVTTETVTDAMKVLENDPDMAKTIQGLLGGNGDK